MLKNIIFFLISTAFYIYETLDLLLVTGLEYRPETELDAWIYGLRMLLLLFVIPFMYLYKILDYFGQSDWLIYMLGKGRVTIRGNEGTQLKLFYFALYFLLFILLIIRLTKTISF